MKRHARHLAVGTAQTIRRMAFRPVDPAVNVKCQGLGRRAECPHLAVLLHPQKHEQPNQCFATSQATSLGLLHPSACTLVVVPDPFRGFTFDEQDNVKSKPLQPVRDILEGWTLVQEDTAPLRFSDCRSANPKGAVVCASQSEIYGSAYGAWLMLSIYAPVSRGGQQSFSETLWAEAFRSSLPLAHAGCPPLIHPVLSARPSMHVCLRLPARPLAGGWAQISG